jgi:hypothetical protein
VFFTTPAGQLIDSFIDLLFLLDVISIFRTTYLDLEGQEISDQVMIAENYFKGNFITDVISSLPLDDIFRTGVPEI